MDAMRNLVLAIVLIMLSMIETVFAQADSIADLDFATLPDYPVLYRGILDSIQDSDQRMPLSAFHAAVISARLYGISSDLSGSQTSLDFFRWGLGAVTAQQEGRPILDGFHEHRSFALACLDLQRLGMLTDADRAELRPVVEAWLSQFIESFDPDARWYPYADNNIRLANVVCGAALSAYLALVDEAQSAPLRQKVDAHIDEYWARLMQTGDLDENAGNYTALGQAFMLDLAHIMGRTEDLVVSEDFRRMFTRRRDVVSPAGIIPEYGDSYFSYTPGALDVCYVLESAAKLYHDPSLLVPARQHYQAAMNANLGVRDGDNWYRGFGLITLEPSPYQPGFPDTSPSRVTRRNRSVDAGIERDLVDKLILKTGWAPGSAMVMMDVYASGSHAHLEKGPSIAYFETAGVPLFHNMGRHGTRSAITGNIFWAMPEYDQFPGTWEEGEWFTMTIPLNHLPKVGENEYRIGRDILFRNFQERNRQVEYLYFDNVRLEGPAGSLLIDDFEDASTWHGNVSRHPGVELVPSEDATQGQYSQRVNWSVLGSGYRTRLFKNQRNFNFSGDDYHALKFDVKYTGQRPYMHIRSVVRTQIDLADQPLPNTIASAHAEQRGDDAYGEVNYSHYTVGNARLTRRMVLTREGVLVIQDTCVPGPEMTDWSGGQLWQIYELAKRGEDWFSSAPLGEYPSATDGPRQMLVKYHTDTDTGTFAGKIGQNYHHPNPKGRKGTEFFTTGSLRRMDGSDPEVFVMIVVPHPPTVDAANLAAKIEFSSPEPGHHVVTLPSPNADGSSLHIRIGPDQWTVRR